MAKRKQIGLIGSFAIAAATLAGGAQQVNASTPSETRVQDNKKEALPEKQNATKPVQQKKLHNQFGNASNPYKHIKTPKKNQRQKRKFNRQVQRFK